MPIHTVAVFCCRGRYKAFWRVRCFLKTTLSRLMSSLHGSVPENADEAHEHAAALAVQNAALRVQVSQARQELDSAIDHAIITMDGHGCVTSWNTGAQRILGYAEAEVLGRTGEIVFTSEDRAGGRFATEMAHALETGSALNERWHVRRDGTRFWASGTMLPLLDEDGTPGRLPQHPARPDRCPGGARSVVRC